MGLVIARERRIKSARVSSAVVDGVMPIIIVIGIGSVPPAIVRLKRVMRPAHACVGTRHHNVLSSETQ